MPARGQPAGERRTGLAGADDDGVEARHGTASHDEEGAADRDRVLDERRRTIAAERRRRAARGTPGRRACPITAPTTPAMTPDDERSARGADRRARQAAGDDARAELHGTVRLGVVGS